MRRILVVGVITLMVSAGVAVNARKQGSYTRYGAGISSCGTWLEARRSSNEIGWLSSGQWILGWLSAAGYYGVDLKKTDPAAITAWIDNYCAANPLSDLEEAARGLVQALRVK